MTTLTFTQFPSVTPHTKTEITESWPEFVARLRAIPTYRTKRACPLISLCAYGDEVTTKGSIRHADNVLAAHGIEIDYDAELMSPEEAAEALQMAGVLAVVVTSASHKPKAPRWRAYLPLSAPVAPEQRRELVARANRILDGVASRESFTLSQSYYVGRVASVEYQVLEAEGRPIDRVGDIEPLYPAGKTTPAGERDATTDADLRSAFARGEDRYTAMLKLSSRWAARGMDATDIAANLEALIDGAGKGAENADGVDLRARVAGIADSAVDKFGETRATKIATAANAGFPDLTAQGAGRTGPRTAQELIVKTFDPIRWTVPNILPEGVYLLVAPPKIGKSWLSLQIALAVAGGGEVLGERATQGGALVLALEDSDRRLKSRLEKMGAADICSTEQLEHVHFETTWPRVDQGGAKLLDEWLTAHCGTRFVVVDVLERFRAPRSPKGNSYSEDYAALIALQGLARKHGITVLVVHHTRKAQADDPLEMVSGTQGLAGAADGLLLLKRGRGEGRGELHIIGRDLEREGAYVVEFSRADCRWYMVGDAAMVSRSATRQEVVDVLRVAGKAMAPTEIASLTQRDRRGVFKLLQGLVTEGIVANNAGRYSLTDKGDRGDEDDLGVMGDDGDKGDEGDSSVTRHPRSPLSPSSPSVGRA